MRGWRLSTDGGRWQQQGRSLVLSDHGRVLEPAYLKPRKGLNQASDEGKVDEI